VYAVLKSITVNDDICREVDALGGIDSITRHIALETAGEPVTAAQLSSASADAEGDASDAATRAPSGLSSLAEEADGADEAEGGAAATPAAAPPSTPATASAPSAADGTPAACAAASARVRLVKTGLRLLRTLANSDPNKVKMGAGATLGVLLQAFDTFCEAPGVLDQASSAIANLCLRLSDNAARAHARGALPLISRAMRKHPGAASLQRSACLAVRNLVVKSPERVQAAFDAGLETLLQAAYTRHPTARDVAYAALRDMGVSYAETTTGRAQAERAALAIAAGDKWRDVKPVDVIPGI
jgi:hypothetical protein